MLSRLLLTSLLIAGALAWRFAPVAVEPGLRVAAAGALALALGALEPALVVVVAAEIGARIGTRAPHGYALALAAAGAVLAAELLRWRRRPLPRAAWLPVPVLAAAALFWPAALVDAAAAAAAAFVGTRILFPRTALGAPSLLSLLGGLYVFSFGLVVQLYLHWVLLGLLRRPLARVRLAGRRGMSAIVRSVPYVRRDLDPIDVSRPAVIVANHQSSLDIVLVLGLTGDVRLTTSPRVWDEPWLGITARRLGHIRVDENLLESCRAVVAEGASIQVYPEGTRSRDGAPARFRRGAFELAVQLGLDVQPVVLCDSRIVVPRDAYWVDRGHVVVRALPRVPPGADSRALQKRVQGLVRDAFTDEMRKLNTPSYLASKVRRMYRYQGWRVQRAVSTALRDAAAPARPASEPVVVDGGDFGARALLLAECHPGLRIVVRSSDPRRLAVARHAARAHPRMRFEGPDGAPADAAAPPRPPRAA